MIVSTLDHLQMFNNVVALKNSASVYNFTEKNKSTIGAVFETPQDFTVQLSYRTTLGNFLFELESTPTTDFHLAYSDKHLDLLQDF